MAGPTDARLLFWELSLPNQQEIDRIDASLAENGFEAYTDPWGIRVALVKN